MKDVPNKWKRYFLLLSIVVLVTTVLTDQYLTSSSPNDPGPDFSHNHEDTHNHDKTSKSSTSLDEAFNQAPDSDAVPFNPEKEQRMAIFHYNEGNKFLNQGNWKEAVANYKMALHHDKSLQEVYINMSNAYLKGKQYEEAKKTLDSLKVMAPKNPHLFYNLACYYSLTHRESASLEALQQAFRLGYKNREQSLTDPDLVNLRRTPEYQQWVKNL